MGGQACVLYGAVQFSRDTDFAVLCEPENIKAIQAALDELGARRIAVPPFEPQYLERGHAIHFRCADPKGMRVDIMSVLRNVDPFSLLWQRRTEIELTGQTIIPVISIVDLVQAKKTQRDKDWLMIRRLVDTHYISHRNQPNAERIHFWLKELRSAELLVDAIATFHDHAKPLADLRFAIAAGINGDKALIEQKLADEERRERDADRAYWLPLRRELEQLRHSEHSNNISGSNGVS